MRFQVMHEDCDKPVAAAIEAYRERDDKSNGSLEAVAYVCLGHVHAAREKWFGESLMPYAVEDNGRIFRCGSITDFRDQQPA
ncbi:hypothetical protein ACFYNY_36310 [Streptomyces sp. NPDC006530]|uniref:hypothetical protein n=1 Tax=Streptomyces sp. NPDC006530 TaxID=3364750 RepID=UPI0036AB06D5